MAMEDGSSIGSLSLPCSIRWISVRCPTSIPTTTKRIDVSIFNKMRMFITLCNSQWAKSPKKSVGVYF